MHHQFGFGKGWVPNNIARLLEKLARRYGGPGCKFYRVNFPGLGWHYWFVLPNHGNALDPTIEQNIRSVLAAKGIVLP